MIGPAIKKAAGGPTTEVKNLTVIEAEKTTEIKQRANEELACCESQNRIEVLDYYSLVARTGSMPIDDYRDLVRDWWNCCDGIPAVFGHSIWKPIKEHGPVVDKEGKVLWNCIKNLDKVMIYRSQCSGSPTGWSWTTSIRTATWFALEYAKGPRARFVFNGQDPGVEILAASVPVPSIIGCFDSRQEREIVVDPGKILCRKIEPKDRGELFQWQS